MSTGTVGALAGPCPALSFADCDGLCIANVVLEAWLGDGVCQTPDSLLAELYTVGGVAANLNCEAWEFDQGDCASEADIVACVGPEVTLDCAGNCAPVEWIHDGFCDDGTAPKSTMSGQSIDLNCLQLGFDGGDCIADTLPSQPSPSSPASTNGNGGFMFTFPPIPPTPGTVVVPTPPPPPPPPPPSPPPVPSAPSPPPPSPPNPVPPIITPPPADTLGGFDLLDADPPEIPQASPPPLASPHLPSRPPPDTSQPVPVPIPLPIPVPRPEDASDDAPPVVPTPPAEEEEEAIYLTTQLLVFAGETQLWIWTSRMDAFQTMNFTLTVADDAAQQQLSGLVAAPVISWKVPDASNDVDRAFQPTDLAIDTITGLVQVFFDTTFDAVTLLSHGFDSQPQVLAILTLDPTFETQCLGICSPGPFSISDLSIKYAATLTPSEPTTPSTDAGTPSVPDEYVDYLQTSIWAGPVLKGDISGSFGIAAIHISTLHEITGVSFQVLQNRTLTPSSGSGSDPVTILAVSGGVAEAFGMPIVHTHSSGHVYAISVASSIPGGTSGVLMYIHVRGESIGTPVCLHDLKVSISIDSLSMYPQSKVEIPLQSDETCTLASPSSWPSPPPDSQTPPTPAPPLAPANDDTPPAEPDLLRSPSLMPVPMPTPGDVDFETAGDPIGNGTPSGQPDSDSGSDAPTLNNNGDDSNEGDSTSTVAIIGVVAGAAAVGVLAGIFAIVLVRRHKQGQNTTSSTDPASGAKAGKRSNSAREKEKYKSSSRPGVDDVDVECGKRNKKHRQRTTSHSISIADDIGDEAAVSESVRDKIQTIDIPGTQRASGSKAARVHHTVTKRGSKAPKERKLASATVRLSLDDEQSTGPMKVCTNRDSSSSDQDEGSEVPASYLPKAAAQDRGPDRGMPVFEHVDTPSSTDDESSYQVVDIDENSAPVYHPGEAYRSKVRSVRRAEPTMRAAEGPVTAANTERSNLSLASETQAPPLVATRAGQNSRELHRSERSKRRGDRKGASSSKPSSKAASSSHVGDQLVKYRDEHASSISRTRK
mmetsp:Transcript_7850/g.29043  ORF Transcript_7850/g.29043 Transcript_7850/m.29043 type:complete len:1045 (+) Transcript_7850:315-3449(+)